MGSPALSSPASGSPHQSAAVGLGRIFTCMRDGVLMIAPPTAVTCWFATPASGVVHPKCSEARRRIMTTPTTIQTSMYPGTPIYMQDGVRDRADDRCRHRQVPRPQHIRRFAAQDVAQQAAANRRDDAEQHRRDDGEARSSDPSACRRTCTAPAPPHRSARTRDSRGRRADETGIRWRRPQRPCRGSPRSPAPRAARAQ